MKIEEIAEFIEKSVRDYMGSDLFVVGYTNGPIVQEIDQNGHIVCAKTQTYCNGIKTEEGAQRAWYYSPEEAIAATIQQFDPSTIDIGQNCDDPLPSNKKTVKLFWRIIPEIQEYHDRTKFVVRMRLAVMRIYEGD
jgi:hypothetical protein